MRPGARAVVLAVAALGAGACAGGTGSAPAAPAATTATATALPAGVDLAVEVQQYRRDTGVRQLEVTVTNDGAVPVLLATVDLRSPGLSARGRTTDAALAPGRTVDLVTVFDRAVCPAPGAPAGSAGDVTVAIGLGVGGAAPVPVELALPGPAPVLDLVYARQCALQAQQAAYTLDWAGPWTQQVDAHGPVLTSALRLRRGDGIGSVLVTGQASNIIAVVEVPGAPVGLAPGQDEVVVPVRLRVQRCDGHALTGSRTYYVRFFVTAGSSAPLPVDTLPDAKGVAAIDALRAAACPA